MKYCEKRVRGDEAAQNAEVVCNRREPLARRFRWDMDRVEWHSRHESKPGRGQPSALRLPDDQAERRRRTDPSEGDARDPDGRGGIRRVDARAVG